MTPGRPLLSVIVPAHQAAGVVEHCLTALTRSDLPRDVWELVVVDDASTDDTALVAAPYADTVVRLAGAPHGPAYARNRGAEVSRGDVLVFVDADVTVHGDALRRFATLFAGAPQVCAAFGSYDDRPPAPGLVSQYRNLLHHYVHWKGAGEAVTFWPGLGAIRRQEFSRAGMFNEWHDSRPRIEDIELGRRLRRGGQRIVLDPDVQGCHLKRWTFRSMMASDFKNRGAASVVGLDLGFYSFLRRRRGVWFALSVLPLHLVHYVTNVLSGGLGRLSRVVFGEPYPDPRWQALAQMGVKTWPPTPTRLRRPSSGAHAVGTGPPEAVP